MEIDIRNLALPKKIRAIRFAEPFTAINRAQADVLHLDEGTIDIHESETEDYVRIRSKEQARNLIEALKKALDLVENLPENDNKN